MPHVYILHSKSRNKFYVGFTTKDVSLRLQRHNDNYYENKFTAYGKPWTLFCSIKCDSVKQARKIEDHIKSMKSVKYIHNLILFPDIIEKLKSKYLNG